MVWSWSALAAVKNFNDPLSKLYLQCMQDKAYVYTLNTELVLKLIYQRTTRPIYLPHSTKGAPGKESGCFKHQRYQVWILTTINHRRHFWEYVFKIGHSWPLFSLLFVFSIELTLNIQYKFCQWLDSNCGPLEPLYQMSHNHCPRRTCVCWLQYLPT